MREDPRPEPGLPDIAASSSRTAPPGSMARGGSQSTSLHNPGGIAARAAEVAQPAAGGKAEARRRGRGRGRLRPLRDPPVEAPLGLQGALTCLSASGFWRGLKMRGEGVAAELRLAPGRAIPEGQPVRSQTSKPHLSKSGLFSFLPYSFLQTTTN